MQELDKNVNMIFDRLKKKKSPKRKFKKNIEDNESVNVNLENIPKDQFGTLQQSDNNHHLEGIPRQQQIGPIEEVR